MLSSLTYSYALMYRQLRTDKHIECRLPTIERVNQFCWPFLFTLCTCALMDLQLGTDKHSWGFGSTGKKSHQRQFDTWVCACMLVLLCVGALHCVSSTDKRSHFCWFSSWVCVCVCAWGVCVCEIPLHCLGLVEQKSRLVHCFGSIGKEPQTPHFNYWVDVCNLRVAVSGCVQMVDGCGCVHSNGCECTELVFSKAHTFEVLCKLKQVRCCT
jgi:hypothetical protein